MEKLFWEGSNMTGIFSQRAWEKVWLYREGFLLGLWTTIKTAFFSLLLALALGILFVLMSTSGKKPLRMIGRVYVEFIQNTPVLLQLCFLYYALAFSGHGIGILATGSIALGIYHGAYMSEVVRAGIEAIPKGQSEAAQSQGFGYMERMYYIILPQSIRTCIHNRMMQAGQGIFPPCKAKKRSNTWCIARFFNAAGREKTWPDGVRRL
jgi:putative glutamine transport system permease protein